MAEDRIERRQPPADLRPVVEAFAARRAFGPRAAFPVFPTARVEILFHFGDPFLVAGDSLASARPLPPAALLGPRSRIYWQSAGPRIDWFLIQLTPLGCRRLLGLPFAELWELELALADLWGGVAGQLHERLRLAASFGQRSELAAAVLRGLWRGAGAGDATVSRLVSLARAGALRSVGQLAAASDLGPRRLRQRFQAETGVGPKRFLAILRFGRLLAATHPRPWRADAGDLEPEFADDSHAIREFRRFAGMTPGAYRAAKAAGDRLVFTGPAVELD